MAARPVERWTSPSLSQTRVRPKTSRTESKTARIIFRTCAGVVQYGGISTMTLPTGRVSTPRRAMASQTRMPARSRKSNGLRVRQSRTSSMPAIKPTCRMSPTFGNDQSVCNSSPKIFSRFCRARMDFSLCRISKLANAAAAPS